MSYSAVNQALEPHRSGDFSFGAILSTAISHIAQLSRSLELIRGDVFRASFRIRPKAGAAVWTGYTMALELYVGNALTPIANTTNFTADGWTHSRIEPAVTLPITWNEATLVWVLTEPGGQPRSVLRARVQARFRRGL
jgi:hypothetical protein